MVASTRPIKNEIGNREIGRFLNHRHIDFYSLSGKQYLPCSPSRVPAPSPLLHLSPHRWTPPHASEGQSAHAFSAGPGNSGATARTPFHASAVNRPAASVRLKRRLSQNPRVFTLTREIAPLVLMLYWSSRESTSKSSNYPRFRFTIKLRYLRLTGTKRRLEIVENKLGIVPEKTPKFEDASETLSVDIR
jgi:hypothetical protein